jgi:hypothetical protein
MQNGAEIVEKFKPAIKIRGIFRLGSVWPDRHWKARRSANKEQSGGEDGQRAACIPESVSIFAGFQSWNAIVRIEAPGDLFS